MADQLIDRVVDPRGWEQAVASDIPLTTHHSAGRDGGRVPRSSCSMPYMVATMLAHLDARPPMRVLEVGTGTGWNAALLAARLGEANVTTVELDSQIAGEAEHAVAAAGYRPHLVVGDGAAGHPPGAPYDRVIATCAVQQLPAAWLAQTRPGGIILTPWGTPYHNGVLLRLEVQPDGHAVGRVVDDATFMWISSQPAIADLMPHIHHADQATVSTTRLDPRGALHEDAAFTIGLHLPGVSHLVGHGTGDEADELTLWLADPDTGSWAAVDYQPDHDEFEVTQYGPRRLWEETEHAYRWWWDAGTPTRFRYGLTVTPTGQHHLWLDQPSHPVFPRVAYNAGSMNACPPAPA
ncbi:MAG: methyltransferase domain-containing protein [Streptomycetales bacterium]